MKTKFIQLSSVVFALFTIVSCSKSSGDTPIDSGDGIPTTYMPLTLANLWNYRVSVQGTDTFDKLTVDSNTTINGITYKKMIGTSDTNGQANGFYCGALNNNNLRIDGSSLKLTGAINYSFPGVSTPISINLTDFVLFKQNATAGAVLSSVSGTTSEDIPVDATTTLPATINYTLRTVADESLATFNTFTTASTPVTYNDVKKVKLILNLKITTFVSTIPATITLLDSQDVFTSTLHYCNNKGMVYNNTLFTYALSAAATQIIPVGSPIPSTATYTFEEFMTTAVLN